ncbi:unnamed protein product [Rotaria socialis]|uniref:Uncharacterized protein n=1 Tax=Rotaria socialis TaxID=392032 RepID=A0A821MP21_9BILA|nr:unnamed protein product [Rotaria socialis]CAF3523188.1 unnamed protein product [Rotaria socialis]CAF4395378.1 unnamed protein product [Rotaria socialis]CAF4771706.1 unnamed protein product [Rotaria socialis]
MGICLCCAQQPPENFVGEWSNGGNVKMQIAVDGSLMYNKETSNGYYRYTTTGVRYNENGFWTCLCCCCTLKGVYGEQEEQKPVFIVRGDVLAKDVAPNH